MVKVVKFGGSSLASAEQFEKVRSIVLADESRVFVVPSAPGRRFSGDTKVTDLLIETYELAAKGVDYSETLREIKSRYDEIITSLGLTDFSPQEDFEIIDLQLKANPQRDFTASRGEYLNGKVLARYLGYEFIDAKDVIFFNEEGNLNDYKTYKVLAKQLETCKRAVIPGFYGLGKDGAVKTFSRGGSDVTGSIVARSCSADVY